MTRRIVRTAIQLVVAASIFSLVLFFLDRNYRVLPPVLHAYMPQHHHGLVVTDMTIATCSSINLFSNCQLDPEVWARIEKDLYLGKGWVSSAYLHVRRLKEEELTEHDKVVMDISVGRLDPTATGAKGEADERWEARPNGLWLKRSSSKYASDSESAITAVDVLFGDDAVEAREGWSIVGTPLRLDANSGIPGTHITVRRGTQKETKKPVPRINDNGKFKILQVSDLHLSTGVGACRDAVPDSYNGGPCEADPRTLDFVTKMVDEENPDLVVFSGDQVNGDTAPDAQTAIFKYAQIVIKRKIPYVTIFGNHDDEKTLSREAQMSIVESLPYSLSKAGPEELEGVGNYYLEILARGSSDHSALTLYMLDTHAYSPNEKKWPGYDWVKPNQIEWFRKTAAGLKPKHKEYTHVHMDLAFIHIPLPEYLGPENYFRGSWREYVTAPSYNSGFRDALVEQGVVMVSCGHDHVNDYCMLSTDGGEMTEDGVETEKRPALWMCYAGGSGFGGYAGYGGYHRRVRVFEVDTNLARITTWKRVEHDEEGQEGQTGKRIDEHVIVEGGKPTAPPPPEEDPQEQQGPPP